MNSLQSSFLAFSIVHITASQVHNYLSRSMRQSCINYMSSSQTEPVSGLFPIDSSLR